MPHTVSHSALLSNGGDEPFRQTLYFMVLAFSRLQTCREAFGRAMSLTGSQFAVLIGTAYRQQVAGVSIRALADHVQLAPTHVTTEVGRLIRKGLLTKRINTQDRRGVLVNCRAGARLPCSRSHRCCEPSTTCSSRTCLAPTSRWCRASCGFLPATPNVPSRKSRASSASVQHPPNEKARSVIELAIPAGIAFKTEREDFDDWYRSGPFCTALRRRRGSGRIGAVCRSVACSGGDEVRDVDAQRRAARVHQGLQGGVGEGDRRQDQGRGLSCGPARRRSAPDRGTAARHHRGGDRAIRAVLRRRPPLPGAGDGRPVQEQRARAQGARRACVSSGDHRNSRHRVAFSPSRCTSTTSSSSPTRLR